MAAERNLTIESGTTFEMSFVYSTGSSVAAATPVNLPGYTGKMVVSSQQGAATPVLTLASGSGTYATPTQGVFGATISANQTKALPFTNGYYYYDIVSSAATPVVKRMLKGKLFVDRD